MVTKKKASEKIIKSIIEALNIFFLISEAAINPEGICRNGMGRATPDPTNCVQTAFLLDGLTSSFLFDICSKRNYGSLGLGKEHGSIYSFSLANTVTYMFLLQQQHCLYFFRFLTAL